MEKVIVWGTGDIAKRLSMQKQQYEVVAYVDNNSEKWGKFFKNRNIISPVQIINYAFDYIIIANIYDYEKIFLQLFKDFGIQKEKIRNFSEFISVDFSKYNCGDIDAPCYNINFQKGILNGDIRLNNDLERIVLSEEKYLTTKYLHYFEVYNNYFSRFRGGECKILEIGVYKGGSLYMWKDYFGKDAKVIGIDINPQCKKFQDKQISIEIGSQEDEDFLNYVIDKYGPFDIIVDDGSHKCFDQIVAFRVLFQSLKNRGIYLCEDVQTSYDEIWGGGYSNPNSFIEYTKKLVDFIHAYHIKEKEKVQNCYTESIHGIHYYNNMVVIEKRESFRPITFIGNKYFFHIPTANKLSDENSEEENK